MHFVILPSPVTICFPKTACTVFPQTHEADANRSGLLHALAAFDQEKIVASIVFRLCAAGQL